MQRRILAVVAAVVVVVLAIVIFLVFPRQPPADTSKAPGVATVVGTPIPVSGLTKYTLVSGQSSASYSVHEDLIFGGVGSHTAVGTSNNVTGSLYLGQNGGRPTLTDVDITVDLTTLQSDSSLRDGHVQNYLNTSQYPNAHFVSTNVTGLPSTYTSGQTITFEIIGNLTLHGVTNRETFDVSGKLSGNSVTGTATTTTLMTDFGITPPNLANIAIVDNTVTLTIHFSAQS